MKTAQHVTLYADQLSWKSGETHYLCVRVVSGSGRVSDEWSDPVPVIIAEELNAVIEETNLTEQQITVDEDRKSTRLNSSHVQISYAVFCLKKKKN